MSRVTYTPAPDPEDERPLGSVNWADPSTAGMSDHVHTFNPEEYHSKDAHGEQHGIRSGPGVNSPGMGAWHAKRQWEEMQRRKGFEAED